MDNWISVTTWADRDWKAALTNYWRMRDGAQRNHDEAALAAAHRFVMIARADYRRRVLGWYRKLCLPIRPGECVPNEVATLLAEARALGELKGDR